MKRKHLKAFTLLECMLAIALSLIVMFALVRLVVLVQREHRLQQAVIDITEKQRYLSHYFTQKLQVATQLGCLSSDQQPLSNYHPANKPAWLAAGVRGSVLLLRSCDSGEEKSKLHEVAYYVAASTAPKLRVLYEKERGSPAQALLIGVSDFQVHIDRSSNNKTRGAQFTMQLVSSDGQLIKPLVFYAAIPRY